MGTARVRWTGRAEGDLGTTAGPGVEGRRQAVEPGRWAWLHQVHGAEVRGVPEPGAVQGDDGDAMVTATPGVILAVFTADCAPVAFSSPEGVVGLAHAGWRGIAAGVLDATADAMRALGATRLEAALGPCIRAECYEFGEDDIDVLERRLGPSVRGRTAGDRPALDLAAAVNASLDRAGVALVADSGRCTACGGQWFSHRAGGDRERQATVVVAAGAVTGRPGGRGGTR
ncbi:MAG TPA: polyphenol oxidase family protein [Acidimicrobiales bacterium]